MFNIQDQCKSLYHESHDGISFPSGKHSNLDLVLYHPFFSHSVESSRKDVMSDKIHYVYHAFQKLSILAVQCYSVSCSFRNLLCWLKEHSSYTLVDVINEIHCYIYLSILHEVMSLFQRSKQDKNIEFE